MHAMSVHKTVRSLLDDDSCLVYDGGDFPFFGMVYHRSLTANRSLTNGTLGMIGWGVPFGLGAKVALPDSKVVLLTGDGSFGFLGMELDTAVRHHLPLIVVVGNDSVWGMDYHQQLKLYGKTVSSELLPTTRYDKLAEALGAYGEYVEEAKELPGALQRAFASGKPALVNVRIKPAPCPLTELAIQLKGGATAV
jgi:acetolactate synthase-1/2/3 large subunit